MSSDTTTVIARYLAHGGAHVVMTRHDSTTQFTATCEACGYINGAGYSGKPEYEIDATRRHVERASQEHAQACRRIPQRLWAEGGAS